ncbi:hypothetical protein K3495_g1033 [Podosphaera aphanis]|nr:hypothetical protein K3495_g1033 [Podosphaera aphanis]
MNTIPTDCRLRVSHWFSCGGPKTNWDYKKFIDRYNDNVEDKTSTRTASFILTKMKQGKYQPLSEYLRDFKYTLAQAKELNWEDRTKIKDLYRGLNNRLTRALYPIEVSGSSDYIPSVNQVCRVAGRIEAHESHTLKHPQSQTRTIFDESYSVPRNSTLGNQEAPGPSREKISAKLDAEGDTPISGLNGISTEILAALVNAIHAKSNGQESSKNERPQAP